MNTGVKQVFNTINLDPEGAVHEDCSTEAGNRLTTFAELMSGAGKSVGVVSTARITHATPAAVCAKTALSGTSGRDTLAGDERDDILDGGTGRDQLFPGEGRG